MSFYTDIEGLYISWVEAGRYYIGMIDGVKLEIDFKVNKLRYHNNNLYAVGDSVVAKYRACGLSLVWKRNIGGVGLAVDDGVYVIGERFHKLSFNGEPLWNIELSGTWIDSKNNKVYVAGNDKVYRTNKHGKITSTRDVPGVTHVIYGDDIYWAGTFNGKVFVENKKWRVEGDALNVTGIEWSKGVFITGTLNGVGNFNEPVMGDVYLALARDGAWVKSAAGLNQGGSNGNIGGEIVVTSNMDVVIPLGATGVHVVAIGSGGEGGSKGAMVEGDVALNSGDILNVEVVQDNVGSGGSAGQGGSGQIDGSDGERGGNGGMASIVRVNGDVVVAAGAGGGNSYDSDGNLVIGGDSGEDGNGEHPGKSNNGNGGGNTPSGDRGSSGANGTNDARDGERGEDGGVAADGGKGGDGYKPYIRRYFFSNPGVEETIDIPEDAVIDFLAIGGKGENTEYTPGGFGGRVEATGLTGYGGQTITILVKGNGKGGEGGEGEGEGEGGEFNYHGANGGGATIIRDANGDIICMAGGGGGAGGGPPRIVDTAGAGGSFGVNNGDGGDGLDTSGEEPVSVPGGRGGISTRTGGEGGESISNSGANGVNGDGGGGGGSKIVIDETFAGGGGGGAGYSYTVDPDAVVETATQFDTPRVMITVYSGPTHVEDGGDGGRGGDGGNGNGLTNGIDSTSIDGGDGANASNGGDGGSPGAGAEGTQKFAEIYNSVFSYTGDTELYEIKDGAYNVNVTTIGANGGDKSLFKGGRGAKVRIRDAPISGTINVRVGGNGILGSKSFNGGAVGGGGATSIDDGDRVIAVSGGGSGAASLFRGSNAGFVPLTGEGESVGQFHSAGYGMLQGSEGKGGIGNKVDSNNITYGGDAGFGGDGAPEINTFASVGAGGGGIGAGGGGASFTGNNGSPGNNSPNVIPSGDGIGGVNSDGSDGGGDGYSNGALNVVGGGGSVGGGGGYGGGGGENTYFVYGSTPGGAGGSYSIIPFNNTTSRVTVSDLKESHGAYIEYEVDNEEGQAGVAGSHGNGGNGANGGGGGGNGYPHGGGGGGFNSSGAGGLSFLNGSPILDAPTSDLPQRVTLQFFGPSDRPNRVAFVCRPIVATTNNNSKYLWRPN